MSPDAMTPDENVPAPNADGEGAWARPIPVRLGEVLVAAGLVAVGLFFIWQAAFLDFGRVGLPGPGFFPFALGIALTLLAGAVLFHAWSAGGRGEAIFLGHRDVVIALLAMAALAAVFERMDSYLALGLFTAVLLLLLARAAVWRVALGATLGMVAVWLFFGVALGVRLPTGEFWQPVTDLIAAVLPPGQP
jgi:tripartite tricarboxylate transporter TctB family protein